MNSSDEATTAPAVKLRQMVNGYRLSQAIHVAAVLGLSDLLADGPRTVQDLAEQASAHPRTLYRLLRALSAAGVYEELDGARFRSTDLGDALRSDAAEPVRDYAAFVGRPYHWQAWSGLLHSAQTGANAFRSVYGVDVWEYRTTHPDESVIFDAAMTANSRFVAASVFDAYDLGRFTELVDVGGGRGAFVAAMLRRWPGLRGVVFDQPHVVSGAAAALAEAGVADRARVVSGTFFESVPGGAEAYLLKNIVHDWLDDEAAAILKVCRRDMLADGVLLLVERVIPGPNRGLDATLSDLNMLVSPGGQERTEAEYTTLLAGAGFRLTRVVPTASDVSILEAVPD